jgi:hypothetical protein
MQNSTNLSAANVDSTQEIGGLAYFLVHMSDYLPDVCLGLIGIILGVLGKSYIYPILNTLLVDRGISLKFYLSSKGNLIIIGTVLLDKELHTPTYFLILNLALSDLLISGFVDTFTVVGTYEILQAFAKAITLILLNSNIDIKKI